VSGSYKAPPPQIAFRGHPDLLTLVPITFKSTQYSDTTDNYDLTMSTCRHYNTPRGCLYNQCRFIHSSPPQADGSVFGNPGVFSSARSTALRSQQQLPFPPGTCRFYYNFGHCRHGEQCKYKHILPENSVPNESFGLASPFFSDSATPSPAEEVTTSATDASRLLDTYCTPSFSFTKPTEMVLFVKILISAEPKKWVSLVLGPLTPCVTFCYTYRMTKTPKRFLKRSPR
jgi:Zinc finger C-x8-C-x5-C-x3-H type (and similar)